MLNLVFKKKHISIDITSIIGMLQLFPNYFPSKKLQRKPNIEHSCRAISWSISHPNQRLYLYENRSKTRVLFNVFRIFNRLYSAPVYNEKQASASLHSTNINDIQIWNISCLQHELHCKCAADSYNIHSHCFRVLQCYG